MKSPFESTTHWIWVAICVALGVIGGVIVARLENHDPIETFIVLTVGSYVAILVWAFTIVPDDFMGGISYLGNPIRGVGSGWTMIWPLFEELEKITKQVIKTDLPVGGVLTKQVVIEEDYVDEEGKKGTRSIEITRATVGLDSTLFTRFGEDEENILQFMQYAPPKLKYAAAHPEEGLLDGEILNLIKNKVLSVARARGSQMDWLTLTNERVQLSKDVSADLLTQMTGTVYDLLGLANHTEYEVEHVVLPPELLEAINKAAAAKKEREAAITKASAEKAAEILDARAKAEVTRIRSEALKAAGEEGKLVILLPALETLAANSHTASLGGFGGLIGDAISSIKKLTGV